MSAPTFRAFRSAEYYNVGSISIAKPTGTVNGDLLIVSVVRNGSNIFAISPPTGWTEIVETNVLGMYVTTSYRFADGSGSDTYTIGATQGMTGSENGLAYVAAYSGVRPSDPTGGFTGLGGFDTSPNATDFYADDLNASLVGFIGVLDYEIPSNAVGFTSRASAAHTAVGLSYKAYDAAHENQVIAADINASLSNTKPWVVHLIQINAANVAPNAPALGTPVAGATADIALGGTFTWSFSDPDYGNTQSAYEFRRRIGLGAYEYWNAVTQNWQAGAFQNMSTTQSVTFPSGKWAVSTTYEWSVRVWDQAGVASPYAFPRNVTVLGAPTAALTGPATPNTTSSRPTATWTLSGGTQAAFELRVESGSYGTTPGSGTTVYSSGEVASAILSHTPTIDLPNSTTLRFFLRARRSDALWSAWVTRDVVMNISAPTAPTLAVAYQSATNRVAITITGTHVQTTYPVTLFRVEYSDDNVNWKPLRNGSSIPGSGTPGPTPQVVYDYEAPTGKLRRYRAFTSREV